MSPPPARSLLAPEHVAMVAKGVSTIVSSRDAALRPSLMRAVGSCITPDGSEITVYLARSQSGQLLQDIASTGHLAVVFSEPATHRSVQLKAGAATLRPATESDRAVLARYVASMEHEVARVGFPPPLTRAMLACRLDDVVAVTFAPEEAYDQTPGPRAGKSLEGR